MRRYVPIAALLAALAVLVPGSAGAPVAGPSPLDGANLLVNGDGESGPASAKVTDPPSPPAGWTTTGGFTQNAYGAADFPSASDSKAVAGGAHFLAGGPGDQSVSTATQAIDVSSAGATIDGGGVYADLRADIGGFGLQADYGTVDAVFRDVGGAELGTMRVGPVTVDDRGGLPIGAFEGYGHTELVQRRGLRRVPAGTRSIAVVLSSVRQEGTFGDGYFDNVSLSLHEHVTVPPPRVGRTIVASPVRGTVMVKTRGNPVARLRGARVLAMHTRIDARRGVVRVESAANDSGAIQSGDFSGGEFTIGQRVAAAPFTVLTLLGGDLNACAAGSQASAARRRGSSLFGHAKGHFRSRTHSSSATVRGTSWEISDVCGATATNVVQGKVDVHDFARDAVVPIANGVKPDLSAHDPPPPPPCDPSDPAGCPVQSPAPHPRRRHASSSYVTARPRKHR